MLHFLNILSSFNTKLKNLTKRGKETKAKKLTGDHYYFDLWMKSMKFLKGSFLVNTPLRETRLKLKKKKVRFLGCRIYSNAL